MTLIDHLRERGVDYRTTHLLFDDQYTVAYFPLFNLSGKLMGYQRYNPSGTKQRPAPKHQDYIIEEKQRYITRVAPKSYGFYGVNTYDIHSKYLFVTEGIFDCIKIHNAGYPAIATLTSTVNKDALRWFKLLPQHIIVMCDNDNAGKLLAKVGHTAVQVPAPYKDLGEMPQEHVNQFITDVLHGFNSTELI
jgi:5S rRNA maturation endonuclease (ribonuclease M5)